MGLQAFINQLRENGDISDVMLNEYAQFGVTPRVYLGATLLPERRVNRNMYREGEVKYRTIIANAGTRYSPAQKKGEGHIGGSMLVELGHSDIAREFTSNDLDTLIQEFDESNQVASGRFIGWLDSMVNLALVEHNERQRWNAIVNAQVIRRGDNQYLETVDYPNPDGQRVAATTDWTDDANDPWDDIFSMKRHLEDKGYSINRLVSSNQVKNVLLRNKHTMRRAGFATVFPDGAGGEIEYTRPMTEADLNQFFASNGLPPLETYDLKYNTEEATERFMPNDVMVFACTTGRNEEVYLTVTPEEDIRLIENVLGYTAVGRAAGQRAPGRVVDIEAKTNKPPRIEAEGWQTSLPVITDPEAVGVITDITLPA